MTDQNRGAYTPQSEAPLPFDARRTRAPSERPVPLTLIVSAVILALIVIALVVFLANQPDGSETAEVPAIEAMKTAPDPATPVTQPRPGLQVYTEGQPMPETPAFAPPPEAPAMRPTTPAAPTPAPAPKTDPVGALTVSAAPKTAPAPKAAPVPTVTPKPAAASSSVQVQIGAFSSVAQADKGWNDVARLLPGQMAGKTKRVESVERDGQTLQRAFVGGFASKADADAFCAALKDQNRSCLVRQ
jgi:cell division protein FtsN